MCAQCVCSMCAQCVCSMCALNVCSMCAQCVLNVCSMCVCVQIIKTTCYNVVQRFHHNAHPVISWYRHLAFAGVFCVGYRRIYVAKRMFALPQPAAPPPPPLTDATEDRQAKRTRYSDEPDLKVVVGTAPHTAEQQQTFHVHPPTHTSVVEFKSSSELLVGIFTRFTTPAMTAGSNSSETLKIQQVRKLTEIVPCGTKEPFTRLISLESARTALIITSG